MNIKILKLIVVIFVSSIVIIFSSSEIISEEFAMGEETKSYYAKNSNNKKIHFSSLNDIDFDNDEDIIFILGNSQTHGINQYKEGQVNYVELLANKFPNESIKSISIPNGSLNEFYMISSYLISKYKIKEIILPVFFDDTRESNVRTDISDFFNGNKEFNFHNISKSTINVEKDEKNDEKLSTQDYSEELLNNLFERNIIWKKRESLRAQVFTFLYKLRNTIFFISPSSIRYRIDEAYNQNFKSLQLLVELCSRNNIILNVYIPPIRSDINIPYDEFEYDEFKQKTRNIVNIYSNFEYSNYEKIVPGKYWGMKSSTNLIRSKEFDFMHFNFEGHKILADSLINFFK